MKIRKYKQLELSSDNEEVFIEAVKAVRDYKTAGLVAGKALETIYANGLHLRICRNWGRFCVKNLRISRSKARRLIFAWHVFSLMVPIGIVIDNEYQARQFAGMSDDEIVAVGMLLRPLAIDGKVSTADVRTEVERVKYPHGKPKPTSSNQIQDEAQLENSLSLAKEALDRGDHSAVMAIVANLESKIHDLRNQRDSSGPAKPCNKSNDEFAIVPSSSKGSKAPTAADAALPVSNKSTDDGRNFGRSESNEEAPLRTRARAAGKRRKRMEKPVAIEVENDIIPIQRWNQVLLVIINRLLAAGQPLPLVPFIRPDISAFTSSSARLTKLENGMYLEWGDSRVGILRKARRLMNAAGYETQTVIVKLASGAIKHF